jgi:positive regulator of sigma E activity
MHLERMATVLEARAGQLELRLDPVTGCAGCAGTRGCGIGPLVNAFRNRAATWCFPLPAGADYRPGDRVRICLAAPRVLRAAALAYGLPLAGLWAGGIAGAFMVPAAADLVGMAGAVVGLTGALLLGRKLGEAGGGPSVLPLGRRAGRSM